MPLLIILALGAIVYGVYVVKPEIFTPAPIGNDEWTRYDALFQQWASIFGVDWMKLKAIAIVESDLGRDNRVAQGLTSGDGKSWGLMQIASGVGSPKEIEIKENATPQELNDPATSVRIAAALLAYLENTFSQYGDEYVIRAYNQGENNTQKMLSGGRDYTGSYFQKYEKALQRVIEGA